jgi:glutamate-1-semialdehyde 2,1-aminomutase
MNEFLRYLDEPEVLEGYRGLDERWNKRASELNAALLEAGVPVRVENMTSVFATLYTQPGCYNWMYQYYLRDQGLTMSWIGTGRFIYSHDLSDEDFREITARMVRAGEQMKADGWWTAPGLTNAAIKTRLSREVMRAMWQRVLGQRPPSSGPALTPATSADAS